MDPLHNLPFWKFLQRTRCRNFHFGRWQVLQQVRCRTFQLKWFCKCINIYMNIKYEIGHRIGRQTPIYVRVIVFQPNYRAAATPFSMSHCTFRSPFSCFFGMQNLGFFWQKRLRPERKSTRQRSCLAASRSGTVRFVIMTFYAIARQLSQLAAVLTPCLWAKHIDISQKSYNMPLQDHNQRLPRSRHQDGTKVNIEKHQNGKSMTTLANAPSLCLHIYMYIYIYIYMF